MKSDRPAALRQWWDNTRLVHAYWTSLVRTKRIPNVSQWMRRTRTLIDCRRALLELPEIYQPIMAPGFEHLEPKRPCQDRLELILKDMPPPGATVNDMGCQLGYFSFALADRGYKVVGYDMLKRNIKICEMINQLSDGRSKPLFVHAKLEPETAGLFGRVDVTLCLAIFHHIIWKEGLEKAKKLVSILRQKTLHRLYFEMGQSNEPVEPWSRYLPDMGHDPFRWIGDFLKEGGFETVRVLGVVPTHVSAVKRYLVAAD